MKKIKSVDVFFNPIAKMDIKLIENVYEDIKLKVFGKYPDKKTRELIKDLMEKSLPLYKIKCDEENNPSETIEAGNIFVRIFDEKNYLYIDVIF